MTESYSDIFNFEDIAICVASQEKNVLFQNQTCKEVCGDQLSKTCLKCKDISLSRNQKALLPFLPKSVSFFGKNQVIANRNCDVYRYIENNKKEFTVFYPNSTQTKDSRLCLEEKGLTNREIEIALLILEKKSNYSIQQALTISKATLKTHLNHIYKKAPELKQFRINRLRNDQNPLVCLSTL